MLLFLLKFDQTLKSWWIVTEVTLNHLKELKLFIIIEIVNKIHGIGFHLTVLVILHQQITENKDKSKFIKAQCGKFYQVRYEFQYEKGGTTQGFSSNVWKKRSWGAFIFLNHAWNDKYMLNPSNKTWINENDIVEELPFPDGMLRKPIQMWFWAMTDKCIMYWKTDCF